MNKFLKLTFMTILIASSTSWAGRPAWKSKSLSTMLVKSLTTIDKVEIQKSQIKEFIHHGEIKLVSELVSVELKNGEIIYEEEIEKVETFNLNTALAGFSKPKKPALSVTPVQMKPILKKPSLSDILNSGIKKPIQINTGTILNSGQLDLQRVLNGNGTGGG